MSNTILGSTKRTWGKFNLTKEQLEKEYAELGNCGKIGKKYHLSEACIRGWMRKYGLPLHTYWARKGGHNILPIAGQKFGKLTVIEKAPRRENENGEARWLCKCDCGNDIITGSNRLRHGITKSCGCLRNIDKCKNSYEQLSHHYWGKIIRGAKIRGFEISITPKQIWEKFIQQDKKCALSGVEINLLNPYRIAGKEQTASLDRIDSSKGYTIDNVQWVHKMVNIMKWDLSDKDFVEWCRKIVAHNSCQTGKIVVEEKGEKDGTDKTIEETKIDSSS